MSRVYEVWDTETRNLVTASETGDEVLAFVREYVAQHGRQYPTSWVLLWDDDASDEAGQVAEGPALIDRAEAVGAGSAPPAPVAPRRTQ